MAEQQVEMTVEDFTYEQTLERIVLLEKKISSLTQRNDQKEYEDTSSSDEDNVGTLEEGCTFDEEEKITELDKDTYTFIMFSRIFGFGSMFGFFVFFIQLLFLVTTLTDLCWYRVINNAEHAAAGCFQVPLKYRTFVQVSQFFSLIFALLKQKDLHSSMSTFLLLCLRENWYPLYVERGEYWTSSHARLFFFRNILLPYMLKFVVAFLVLGISFLVVVQSTNMVDLMMNFSALHIISEFDKIGYWLVKEGYLGKIFREEIKAASRIKLRKQSQLVLNVAPIQTVVILGIFAVMMWLWSGVIRDQWSGALFTKAFGEDCGKNTTTLQKWYGVNDICSLRNMTFIEQNNGTCEIDGCQ